MDCIKNFKEDLIGLKKAILVAVIVLDVLLAVFIFAGIRAGKENISTIVAEYPYSCIELFKGGLASASNYKAYGVGEIKEFYVKKCKEIIGLHNKVKQREQEVLKSRSYRVHSPDVAMLRIRRSQLDLYIAGIKTDRDIEDVRREIKFLNQKVKEAKSRDLVRLSEDNSYALFTEYQSKNKDEFFKEMARVSYLKELKRYWLILLGYISLVALLFAAYMVFRFKTVECGKNNGLFTFFAHCLAILMIPVVFALIEFGYVLITKLLLKDFF